MYQDYGFCTRDELLEKIKRMVSEKRLKHMLGVEEVAISLAEHYGVDSEKAGLAGLLHDYAKEVSKDEFIALIDKYHLDEDLKNWGNNIWHGAVGIYKIREDLGISDPDILRAIEIHTVGSDQMSDLDKIVYIADYIEPNRHFPGVEEARILAKTSLDRAVAYETAHTISHLVEKAIPIYPQTLTTYNAYISALKED